MRQFLKEESEQGMNYPKMGHLEESRRCIKFSIINIVPQKVNVQLIFCA